MKRLRIAVCVCLVTVTVNFMLLYFSRHENLIIPHVRRLRHEGVQQIHQGRFEMSGLLREQVVDTRWNISDGLHFISKQTGDRIEKWMRFTYPRFNITEPNFISARHRNLFHLKTSNYKVIGEPSTQKLLGELFVIRNGSFTLPYECGYKSNISEILEYRDMSFLRHYPSVLPLIVPDGGTFQHFIDGVLPKLIQALTFINQSQVKLMLTPIRDHIIFDMLAKLNFSRNSIAFYTGSFSADHMILTCITPPLHPVLWQKARFLLGASETLTVPEKEAKIVIVTRDGCKNCDRNLLNTNALVLELQRIYSKERVYVFRGPYSLNKTIELFSKTKVVIGTHGGGMYNINFCPVGTSIIEIMPTYSNGKTIAAADTIIWTQSVLLGHQYWRLPSAPINYLGDVMVNITLVKNIIEKINLTIKS